MGIKTDDGWIKEDPQRQYIGPITQVAAPPILKTDYKSPMPCKRCANSRLVLEPKTSITYKEPNGKIHHHSYPERG
jgi:hypothetical protein